jgi:4-amino-4-deoxy-L-arabinose transferase-like glycosyltransferase
VHSESSRRDAAVLGLIAAADLALHVALSGRYGYWVDELYFIACGDHLDWGYVDHPPLIAAVAALSRALFGDSLPGFRVWSGLAGAGLVFLTGWIARALGGGRTAQVTAAIAAAVAPIYAGFAAVLTMNAFEPLFWMGCAYVVIRIAQGAPPRLWVVAGALAGVGLLNKHSMVFFAVALIAGLLISAQRRLLFDAWVAVGALIALLIIAPHLRWQMAHGWPTLELLANARRYQHQPVTPLEFIWGQIQIVQPLALPLWLAGVVYLLADRRAAGVRFLGWTFVIAFVAFMLMQAKTYYLAPIYPLAFAAGAIVVEDVARRRRWVAWTAIALLLVGGAITAPYVLPLLPVSALPTYMQLLGLKEVRSETRRMGDVPQIFADMLGWEDLVAEVARVWARLTPAEREQAAIWGSFYGPAAAVDYFGPRYGLPKAISGHQNYYLWGPGKADGQLLIAIGFSDAALTPWCDRLELAGQIECELCMPDRRIQRIHICRGLKRPLGEFWPLVKCWTCDHPPFLNGSPN